MAITRKQALKILEGHARRVWEHLQKLEAEPDSQASSHWKSEASGWLARMEGVVPHVGKKTGLEWALRIAEWKEKLKD